MSIPEGLVVGLESTVCLGFTIALYWWLGNFRKSRVVVIIATIFTWWTSILLIVLLPTDVSMVCAYMPLMNAMSSVNTYIIHV